MGLYDNIANAAAVAINRGQTATGYGSGYIMPQTGQVAPGGAKPASATPNQIYGGTSPAAIGSIQSQLVSAGYLAGEYREQGWDTQSRDAMEAAIADARFNDMTLSEWLAGQGGYGSSSSSSYGSSSGGSSGGGSAGPTTFTSTSVSLTSRPTAKAVLKQALQVWMGRAPTAKEVENFHKGLNRDERQNPTVTTTTTDGSSSSSTTKASKIEAPNEAAQYAEKAIPQGEAERYQTSNYMGALASMMGM